MAKGRERVRLKAPDAKNLSSRSHSVLAVPGLMSARLYERLTSIYPPGVVAVKLETSR
jgi:hypothetical protein